MKIKEIIKKYSSELKNVTHIPSKETEILLLHILKRNVIWLHLHYNDEFKFENELKKMVNLRAKNYPLEYIINKVSFYGEIFSIEEGVLIPRPETELLVEKAYEKLKILNEEINILEVGTGSGIISIMLAKLLPNIKIISLDINKKALELAKKNAIKHNVEEQIVFIESDLFQELKKNDFTMVISNPPYISDSFKLPKNVSFEPRNALFGGEKGDEILKEIISWTKENKIKYLYCEMGYDQKKPLMNYFKDIENIKNYEFYQDLAKLDRGFCLEFKK